MSKKWYYVLAILLVACSWIGNVWYYEANQLGSTVFLAHHVETSDREGHVFDLYYIEDKRADKTLSTIRIEGYPEQIVTPYPKYAEYQRQYLGKMMVNLNNPARGQGVAEELLKEPVLVREITALYSDGTSEQVDVGEIYIWPGTYNEVKPVEWTSVGSSSDHSGYNSAVIKRPLQLTAFSSKFLDIAEEEGALQIYADIPGQVLGISYRPLPSESQMEQSGMPIQEIQLPAKMNQGDSFRISHQFNMPSREKSMQVYQLMLRTTFTEEGQGTWQEDTIIPYHPSPTDKEMTAYVRERRKGL
ncbi:hypothetical protein GCM10008915_55210 [Bifidobacterium pullorum subsp. gallinarum]